MKNISDNIFFILGYYKSGTTWVQLILDSHPEISCKGEGHFFDTFGQDVLKAVDRYNRQQDWLTKHTFQDFDPFPKITKNDVLEIMRLIVSRLLARTINSDRIKIVGEKTPDYVRYLNFLTRTFPHGKFIHIVRDGRDAAVSGWFHYKRVKPEELKRNHVTFKKWALNAADQWQRETTMAHIAALSNPEQFYELKYEDLIDDTRHEVEKLFKFLDVSCSRSVINSCTKETTFQSLTKGRKRGQEKRSSFYRKGVVGDWKLHFDDETVDQFEKIAQASLTLYKYI